MFAGYQLWAKLVHAYTNTQITRPEDKLPAIAGIAKRTAAVLHDTYVAGLFRGSLPSCLLWRTLGDTVVARVAQFRAPTWSWACLDGALYVPRTESFQGPYAFTSVEEINIDLVEDSNPFGQIKAASIYLKGPLWNATLKPTYHGDYLSEYRANLENGKEGLLTCHLDDEERKLTTRTCALLAIGCRWKPYLSCFVIEGLIIDEHQLDGGIVYTRLGVWDSQDNLWLEEDSK